MDAGNKKIFIIDIDGTVCEAVSNEEGEAKMRIAKPFDDSIKSVNRLFDEGHYVCFFTARTDEHKQATEDWLRKNEVRFHRVVYNKPRKLPPYSEYHFIDDAHVRATTFKGKFTNFVKKNVEIEAFED